MRSWSLFYLKTLSLIFLTTLFINRYVYSSESGGKQESLEAIKTAILTSSYKIMDYHHGNSSINIINIQDFHCHYETQKKHSLLLEKLLKDKSFDLSFIGIEGASGAVDTSFASAHPDKMVKQIVAEEFLKKGFISGIEYYLINSENDDAFLYGIDNPELYKKNTALYLRLQNDLKDEQIKAKENLNYLFELLAHNIESATDENLSAKYYVRYLRGELSLIEFAEILIDFAVKEKINFTKYPQISFVHKIINSKIDSYKLDYEKNTILRNLKPNIPENIYNELAIKDMQSSVGKISNDEFYKNLFECATKYKIDLGKFNQLSKLKGLLQAQDNVRESQLNGEIYSLLAQIKPHANGNFLTSDLLKSLRMIVVLQNMLDLNASREEYDFYLENREKLSLETVLNLISDLSGSNIFTINQDDKTNMEFLLNIAGSFYQEALKRDTLMADSALMMNKKLGGKTIIIVTGGFHSSGLSRIFKEKGINFISIVPVLCGKNFDSTYKNEIMNLNSQFDTRYIDSIGMLMPSSNFKNIFHPTKEFLLAAKWYIFANVISSFQFLLTEPAPPQAIKDMVKSRQNEWVTNLEQTLQRRFKKQIAGGIITPDFIKKQVAKFNDALDKIEFDFDTYVYFHNTFAIPVVIKGKKPAKFVISINPEADVSLDFDGFMDSVEKYKVSDMAIRIWPAQMFDSIISAEEIMPGTREPLSTESKQKIIALFELFGKEVVAKLFENRTQTDIMNILDQMPAYTALKDMVVACGVETASELLLWDYEGFFNLCFISSQMEEHSSMFEYVTMLLSQRAQRNEKEGLIPEFIIEEATISDISKWFSYGEPRTFNYDQWMEVASTNDYFYKTTDPNGDILGMVSARPVNEKNIMVIDLVETTPSKRLNGLGKALVKTIARESMGLGFKGKIALVPAEGSEEFYMNLGFTVDPDNNKYLILEEKAAKRLLGLTDTSEKMSKFNVDQPTLDRFMNLPFVDALEHFTRLINKFEQLTNEDKILIISQLMKFNGLTQEQARGTLRKMLVDPGTFTDAMTELYDKMVDSWMASQADDQSGQNYDVVRPLMTRVLGFVPAIDMYASPAIRDYVDILTRISELQFNYGDYFSSAFNKTLAQRPNTVAMAKKELRQHGFYVDIEILPSTDPRVEGKIATAIDNRVYLNELATRADFWFYLPHEVSHFLNDEKRARVYDAQNIRTLKEIAAALYSVRIDPSNQQRKNFLNMAGAQIMYTALLYELDIITARLQLTKDGADFLNKHNLPKFEGVTKEYLIAVAKSSSGVIQAIAQSELRSKLKFLADDQNLSDDRFAAKVESLIIRTIIETSLARIKSVPDEIDAILSRWVSDQANRRFWQIGKSKTPPAIKVYAKKSEADLGYIDIRHLQNQICTKLRVTADPAQRTALEKEITGWMVTLIRENIKPETQINEISDIFTKNTANCLGYTKLFDMIVSLFGVNVQKILLEYEYQGRVELHAVNLVKYSDGTFEIIDVAQTPEDAVLKSVLARVERNGEKVQEFVPFEEFMKLKPDTFDGVEQKSIDAYTYSTRATTAYFNGKINDAFNYMSVAFRLDPKNPYMAFNMAETAYHHWKKTAKDMGVEPSESDSHNKMLELFNQFELYRIGSNAWSYFQKEIKSGEHALVQVGITNPIGNTGGNIDIYYDLRLRQLQQAKQAEKPPVETAVTPEQKPAEPQRQEPVSQNRVQDILARMDQESILRQTRIDQAQVRTNTDAAINQYRVNELVTTGLEFNSARKLIQIGQQIENLIRQQQFQQVQAMFMGLDPRFAERIMMQFPYILAFMAELLPGWWKGADINELARKANLSEEIKKMVRKQLTGINAITKTQDRDLFRKPDSQMNPLWEIMSKDNIARSLERMFNTGAITQEQYRSFYEALTGNIKVLPRDMSEVHKQNLFGKRDEIPVDGGITVKNGFIIGGLFQIPPDTGNIDLYRSYVENVIREHPQELANALRRYADPMFLYTLNDKLNMPVQELLSRSRGALSVVAQDVFSGVSEQDIYSAVRHNMDSNSAEIIEALFTSNLARSLLSEFIDQIYSLGMLDKSERDIVGYLKKYYVDGDENTNQFKQAASLIGLLVQDNPILKEKVIDITARLHSIDSGKLFYAFMRITLQYPEEYSDIASSILKTGKTEFRPARQIGTSRDYIESAM